MKIEGTCPTRGDYGQVGDTDVPAAAGCFPCQPVRAHASRRQNELPDGLVVEDRYSGLVLIGGRRHDQAPPRVEFKVGDPELVAKPVEVLGAVAAIRHRVRHQASVRVAISAK